MVFWKALEMSKTKIVRPSADAISMMIQRDQIPATGAYVTVKSTTSIVYDTSAHVVFYISYLFSIYLF